MAGDREETPEFRRHHSRVTSSWGSAVFTVFSTVGEGAAPETQPQLALPFFCPWWFRSESPGLIGIRKASIAQAEGHAAKCCIHLLKFAELPEFPGDSVDLSDVLTTFKSGRCNALAVGPDGRSPRVPICAEDVAETGCDDLFDEDVFLVAVCPRHAELLMARAVDGRACTGSVCGGTAYGIDAAADESPVSQPQCGRRHFGSRIYCETCFQVRAETGKTPAKPVRSFRGTSSDGPSSREAEVSPLTESGEGSRSGNVLSNVFGLVGAALGAEAGVGERPKAVGSLSLGQVRRAGPTTRPWFTFRRCHRPRRSRERTRVRVVRVGAGIFIRSWTCSWVCRRAWATSNVARIGRRTSCSHRWTPSSRERSLRRCRRMDRHSERGSRRARWHQVLSSKRAREA